MIVIDYSYVSGASMTPTLHDGQSLLILKCAYGIRKPRNVYEIPIVGIIVYYFTPNSEVDSVLKENKSFEYINPSLPDRGDIVALNIPNQNHFHAVKRCIAVAGDSIPYKRNALPYEIVPYKGMVIKTKILSSNQIKYMQHNKYFSFDSKDSVYIALEDFVYVVGDNLDASEDSRRWGAIPMSLIFGKVIY